MTLVCKDQEDFKIIQNQVNYYTPLEHLNKSEHDNYKKYYNKTRKEIVDDCFAEDIETYQYVF